MADSLIAECSVRCPFCSDEAAKLVSLFGSQLLLSQYRCKSCGSYFEGLREDRWEPEPEPELDAQRQPELDPQPQPEQPETRARHRSTQGDLIEHDR
jgi:hypothetical protein